MECLLPPCSRRDRREKRRRRRRKDRAGSRDDDDDYDYDYDLILAVQGFQKFCTYTGILTYDGTTTTTTITKADGKGGARTGWAGLGWVGLGGVRFATGWCSREGHKEIGKPTQDRKLDGLGCNGARGRLEHHQGREKTSVSLGATRYYLHGKARFWDRASLPFSSSTSVGFFGIEKTSTSTNAPDTSERAIMHRAGVCGLVELLFEDL